MFSSLYWSCSVWHDPIESVGSWKIELESHLLYCQEQLSRASLRRARDYYLYFDRLAGQGSANSISSGLPRQSPDSSRLKKTATLCRLLDLGLDAGQALLGYRPATVSFRLKNVMSRGLYATLPTGSSNLCRLKALLQRLFPCVKRFGLYHDLANAVPQATASTLRKLLLDGQARIGPNQKQLTLWRPLATVKEPYQGLVLPILALSSLPQPYLVLAFADTQMLVPSDICSPLQVETIAQALGQTERLLQQQETDSSYLSEPLAKLRSRLARAGEKKCGELSQWRQDGIYLYWDAWEHGIASYTALWQRCFDEGFLLPANPFAPLVLPPHLVRKAQHKNHTQDLSGEARHLEKLLCSTAT